VTKERDFAHASVSQLRTREWFTAECGLPYGGWEPQSVQKKAVRAHRAAQKAIAAATTTEDVESALVAFVATVNTLPGIETTERDDLGEAVTQLAGTEHARGLITTPRARELHDQHRTY